MARHHGTRKLPVKKLVAPEPKILIDVANDFASIRIAKGVEAKSFVRDGFLFSQDSKGRIIEIQILNLSSIGKLARAG